MSDVAGRITLSPDPGLVKSLGANHSLPTALADLVDNSVDAGATHVLIRFLRSGSMLEEVQVLDDGHGMNSEEINHAMTLGAQRKYGAKALGHFGLGLKAAGLGHADTLTVCSHSHGADPVGRRLQKQDLARDYSCEVLTDTAAAAAAALCQQLLGSGTGTTVGLTDLRSRYSGESELEALAWLHVTTGQVRTHLGLVFHRLIGDERLQLDIEEDLLDGERGVPMRVAPIDPFGYPSPGRPGYPRILGAVVDGRAARFACHIWPPRRTEPAFRLGTRDGRDRQGFYVYRGDRLLAAGGWLNATHAHDDRLLGRVSIEYEDVAEHVSMNPEKNNIRFDASLGRAVHTATDGEVSFAQFLIDAEEVQRAAKRRNRQRKPSVGIAKGFPPQLRRAIQGELEVDERFAPVNIRWKRLSSDELLDLDLQDSTVWLNAAYRDILAGEGRKGLNDAPVLKALVFLLTREKFMGQYLGSKDRDDIALWGSVLREAALAEERSRGYGYE